MKITAQSSPPPSPVMLTGSTCLVDLTGFLHRLAYMPGPHGMDPRKVTSQKTGEPTWGIVGSLNQLHTLAKLKPARIVAFADSSRNGFRQELLPSYKRKSGSEYIHRQLERLAKSLPAMGIPVVGAREEFPGLEAEDLIAKAVMDAKEEVTIVSYDKDLLQLVGAQARLYNPQKKLLVDASSIEGQLKSQFLPTKAPLAGPDLAVFLAVTGDETDGVEPIGGIGPATLAAYYEQIEPHLNTEGKIEALAAVDRRTRAATDKPVTANWEKALLNLQATDLLSQRQRDLTLGALPDLRPDKEAFRVVLEELTMGAFLKNYAQWFAPFEKLNLPVVGIDSLA